MHRVFHNNVDVLRGAIGVTLLSYTHRVYYILDYYSLQPRSINGATRYNIVISEVLPRGLFEQMESTLPSQSSVLSSPRVESAA
jgi:hypothetical protein